MDALSNGISKAKKRNSRKSVKHVKRHSQSRNFRTSRPFLWLDGPYLVIINAPLFLIVRDVIFYEGNTHNRQIFEVFRVGPDFLTPKIALALMRAKKPS